MNEPRCRTRTINAYIFFHTGNLLIINKLNVHYGYDKLLIFNDLNIFCIMAVVFTPNLPYFVIHENQSQNWGKERSLRYVISSSSRLHVAG